MGEGGDSFLPNVVSYIRNYTVVHNPRKITKMLRDIVSFFSVQPVCPILTRRDEKYRLTLNFVTDDTTTPVNNIEWIFSLLDVTQVILAVRDVSVSIVCPEMSVRNY